MNAELPAALGRALHRPALLPTPLAPLKLVYGRELVQHLLVEGQRVVPRALEAAGFAFAYPTIDGALGAVLAETAR
jgi:NAD dependent epimerase/dehydratase family enzyme